MSEVKKEGPKTDDQEDQLRAMALREAFVNAIENLPVNYLIWIGIGKKQGGVCIENPDGSISEISSEGKLSSDINNAFHQVVNDCFVEDSGVTSIHSKKAEGYHNWQVGKRYKTRCGLDGLVLSIKGPNGSPIVVLYYVGNESFTLHHQINGKYNDNDLENGWDLIPPNGELVEL